VDAVWQAGRLILKPSGHGQKYGVEVTDAGGTALATCAADGEIRDASGALLLGAPLSWHDRGDKPTDALVAIADADGTPLATARVTKYGVGPRAKKATLDVTDPRGEPLLRLEPRDKRGEELALTAGETELATATIEQVKAGFLRKARVYTVELGPAAPEPLRPLALATMIRYDALLNAVVSAAASD